MRDVNDRSKYYSNPDTGHQTPEIPISRCPQRYNERAGNLGRLKKEHLQLTVTPPCES